MDSVAEAWPRRAATPAAGQLRRHWALVVLVGIAAVPRVAMMVAYTPAFWYQGDSGVYLHRALAHVPDVRSPYGYSFALSILQQLPTAATRPLWLVPLAQHLGGLVIAVACYAFLQWRGVSRWVSLLAMAPLLLDARTVVLEHYILSDVLFTALVVTAVIVLTGRARPGWVACAAAGGIFAAAGLTRTVGLALLVLPGLYLVIRRVGWLRLAAFVIAAVIPVAGYMTWYHSSHGVYSTGTFSGRFLWSRVSTFVDCGKINNLTADERRLCPTQPLGQRLEPDLYLWDPTSANTFFSERKYDKVFASFARKAILAQPGAYAWTVTRDTWFFVRPGPEQDSRVTCLANLWKVPQPDPDGPRLPAEFTPWLCQPTMTSGNLRAAERTEVASTRSGWLPTELNLYSRFLTMPGTVIGLAVLLALGLALWRPRRSSLRDVLDPILWAGLGAGIVVVSVGTSASDPRYGVPALPLAVTGAALAWHRLRTSGSGDRDTELPASGAPADGSPAGSDPSAPQPALAATSEQQRTATAG